MHNTQLVWFRSDLRITDNPALFCASETNNPIMGVFFICEQQWQAHDYGVAKVDFIHRQLTTLAHELKKLDIPLIVQSVSTYEDIPKKLLELTSQHTISKVWCNKELELNETKRDFECINTLSEHNIDCEVLDDQCIVAPKQVLTKNNSMYKVFTPFYRCWQKVLEERPVECVSAPTHNKEAQQNIPDLPVDIPPLQLYDLKNLPTQVQSLFPAGEETALSLLLKFSQRNLLTYSDTRNEPSLDATSYLSAYLSIGAISPRQCYVVAKQAQQKSPYYEHIQTWISELCWRDFYRHLIVDNPRIVQHHAFNENTDKKIHWSYDEDSFSKWCNGQTGVPIIDSAMRCLNNTGFMHNRLRMVVAMFLTKNLFIDWRWGERYFMQRLVDADFASNNGGWQWSASVGTDAAPYFRVMNPFNQGKTHDKDAEFIKMWIPELQKIDPKIIHDPDKLTKISLSLGYPKPIVDVKKTRADAIAAFKMISQ